MVQKEDSNRFYLPMGQLKSIVLSMKFGFNKAFSTAFKIIALLWIAFLVDLLFPLDMRMFGIYPRRLEGLVGIACAPFLHANFGHLLANSTALLFLLAISLGYSQRLTFRALVIIVVVGGLGVWLFGSPHGVHIGASGVIFGLIGFLLTIGIVRREWLSLAVSLFVAMAYGGVVETLLTDTPGVSWSGHFWGLAGGVVAAWRLKRTQR